MRYVIQLSVVAVVLSHCVAFVSEPASLCYEKLVTHSATRAPFEKEEETCWSLSEPQLSLTSLH